MKANPGGDIGPDAVYGRGKLIEFIWDTLDQQSVLMTAERRIGKTTVVRTMAAKPREGWLPIFQDLEKCYSANDFAKLVYVEIGQFLTSGQKVARNAFTFLKSLGGVEIGGVVKVPALSGKDWKDLLIHSVRDLAEAREEGESQLVFFWDEVPYMLGHIRDRDGEATALEVMDVLRALRQEDGLRMVITGSVGIHHVLTKLNTMAEATINDLYKIEVTPLEGGDSETLAGVLLDGEGLVCDDRGAVAAAIAEEVDHFPFYIHHVVKALTLEGGEVSAQRCRQLVQKFLVDDNDPWNLGHFHSRLSEYYGQDKGRVCLILDELCVVDEAVSISDLQTRVKAVSDFDDREKLIALLKLLVRDHYLGREDSGGYVFKFTLIKRWWSLSRGL